ncbi:Protein ACCELERATED CELL DEATH 6 [Cardamine amara subsp. amara]|uniref:Protein ACCELERATED CELL DEATH 6 n=1 Tax=Cardamine amara subsp. amara TaxID=228776 RepID=A0ABD0ZDF0_CARAN
MAVEAGGLAIVKAMLEGLGNNVQDLASQLEGRKSLVHAALKAKNRDILDAILNKEPSLVNERDEGGLTCLSVGASVGYLKGVCNLLDRSTSSVFECNDDGCFPIHMAVEKGHVDVVKEILKRCPDSIELLNKKGQNILHIAAKSGKSRSLLLKYIKRHDRKNNHLIEEQDEDGNTPLHLATINWRARNVRDLTRFSSNAAKILKIENKDGLRALDIAELNLQSNYIFRERMTLMVLLSAYKPRGYEKIPTSGMTLRSRSEVLDANKYKDSVNALLLVATLVATVTFAAGITVPGGFNSSGPDVGMAILASNFNFIFFMLADVVAMQSSLVAIIALVWAQMGDPELVHRAFQLALPSISLALSSMSFAFLYGVLATTNGTSHAYFLGSVTPIIHSVFTIVFSYLLANYVGPYIPCFRSFRSMDAYLRVLVRFVNEDDAETYHTSGSGKISV